MGEISGSPERAPSRRERPKKKSTQSEQKSTRRDFLKKAGRETLKLGAAFGAGHLFGSAWESISLPELTSDEPYELQIPSFEYKLRNLELLDIPEEDRNKFTWLVCLWFSENANAGFNNPVADPEKIYRSIEWITDPKDERLEGMEDTLAWVDHTDETRKRILVNLTNEFYKKGKAHNSYTLLSPITVLRDVLTHEIVHYVTRNVERPETTALISEIKGIEMKNPVFYGFKITYLDEKGENKVIFSDLEEAITEIISKQMQLASGIGPGLPSYSEESIPGIGQTITNLRAYLDLYDIGILGDVFASHVYSDPGGLARDFGKFNKGTDLEREAQGFLILESIFSGTINDYFKKPPRSP